MEPPVAEASVPQLCILALALLLFRLDHNKHVFPTCTPSPAPHGNGSFPGPAWWCSLLSLHVL